MPYKRGGVRQCVVVNCSDNQKKLYDWENSPCQFHNDVNGKDCPCLVPFKFHCIPASGENRLQWLKSINRKGFDPPTKSVVCSKHFIDGRPTKQNPIPVLEMGYRPVTPKTPGRRPLKRLRLESYENSSPRQSQPQPDPLSTPVKRPSPKVSCPPDEMLTATPITDADEAFTDCQQCLSICCQKYPQHCHNANKPKLVVSSTQTIDLVAHDHTYWYSLKTKTVSTQHSSAEFGFENIQTDTDSRFYTGLSLSVFMTLISTLSTYGKGFPYRMSVPNQILSVLLRLRLALTFEDIGRRFGVSHQLMSNVFKSWINVMSQHLSHCVVWLPRDTIRRTLPNSFKTSFPKTTCIIDCSESFIQRPFSLKARAQTWSTYKSNNTAKFLIAIAPNGFIMYISPLYGGRASDNFITKNCGFLDYLLPGDEVMADRGFTIGEDLCSRRVKLNIPAFMKGRSQLSEQETIDSRRIAAERIHVERAIMRMKSFRLLNTKYSIKTLHNADKTVRVVAALCNMRDSLIRDDVVD
ncbi:uncharacterized protein LOC128220189 [Mya arenaria]|uniref:uncharacterized protein LOC128220189 n=1 Tax=Mya arenaria TaxID=6604 RepID=UPI0022DF56FA|nr:uncharacterized protein LOC128220189 [Mya arenaria]